MIMRIYPANLHPQRVKAVSHRSLSRDTSENGVSSRVDACRKRLRIVRSNQKGPMETVEPAGILVAANIENSTEASRSPMAIETIVEMLDEAGIT
jgi:hypothetical protein